MHHGCPAAKVGVGKAHHVHCTLSNVLVQRFSLCIERIDLSRQLNRFFRIAFYKHRNCKPGMIESSGSINSRSYFKNYITYIYCFVIPCYLE